MAENDTLTRAAREQGLDVNPQCQVHWTRLDTSASRGARSNRVHWTRFCELVRRGCWRPFAPGSELNLESPRFDHVVTLELPCCVADANPEVANSAQARSHGHGRDSHERLAVGAGAIAC